MRDSAEKEIIKMWSDKLKKDAWWVVDGDNYIGPFNKWCDAKRLTADYVPKTFDITKHEFSDAAKDCHILFNNPKWAGDDLQIEMADSNGTCVDGILIKEHAIAIAKHFNLTGEDLK